MTGDIHYHIHQNNTESPNKPQNKGKGSKPLSKREKARINARKALSNHFKLTFKNSKGFFKHFSISIFYLLKILGFTLQDYNSKQNKQRKGQRKTFKEIPPKKQDKDWLRW